MTKPLPQLITQLIIIPIPKGDKDSTIQGNNRGITLLPVIGKVFEKITFSRHNEWAGKRDPLDQLQGAAQEKCSSTHTSLLLRETVAHNVERDSAVYIALVDVEKAFDKIWINALLYKLYRDGMDPVIWLLLRKSYTNFTCKVRIGELSESFIAGQGVHQGAPWSMYLFEKYYDDLLKTLKNSGMGTQIYGIQTGNPAFADDLCITTLHKPMLQSQLDKVYEFSTKWRMKFNPTKSAIVIVGKDTMPSISVTIGGLTIPVKEGEQHMGIFIGTNHELEIKFLKKRVHKARTAFFSSLSIDQCP